MTDKPTSSPNTVVGKPDATGIYRHGFGLKSAVQDEIVSDYHGPIVEQLRNNDYTLQVGSLRLVLAREFGFCYGVDKAVDFAYQTRRMFPERRVFLTTEIIHNPGVNRRMREMGIEFLHGQYANGTTLDQLRPDDVVILPAFGASVAEVEQLRQLGVTLVDTTCGSVVHVWKRVEKYAKDGFTAIIHGKYSHEETIGTSSRVTQYPGGRYLVVRDKAEADVVCNFIRGSVSAATISDKFSRATSEGFEPTRDLQRVGVANQTTMLSSESLEIADMLREAMIDRYGLDTVDDHFRNFDTICSATQERQDAVHAMGSQKPDLILVVGGFNSSNTTHLIEIAGHYAPAYHIEDASYLVSPTQIRHKRWNSAETEISENWLPTLPATIGFTAGASTPNKAVGEVIEKVMEFAGVLGPEF
ncbi:MAG: 4-hydroxy-3-methylbut-2-enyl diphosphate reductase [Candidatus Sumerlaeaceae bacterium]|nr:4-hydroxy-3-methylbut-2-enyl diphosphate reductase [Candidatus Sumerlaeaceae bacterium]